MSNIDVLDEQANLPSINTKAIKSPLALVLEAFTDEVHCEVLHC